jgi:putative flippase GtrA
MPMNFLKYIWVGLLNTAIGYTVFLFLVGYLNITPEFANFMGYIFVLTIAYTLNKIYVFRGSAVAQNPMLKFILCFILSFLINHCVLIFFYRFMGFAAEISQIPAMICYTVVFYFLNRRFVFHVAD